MRPLYRPGEGRNLRGVRAARAAVRWGCPAHRL